MSNDLSPPTAAQWPDLSSWPDDDAPPIEVARWARDQCGWIVLPTAGPMDVIGYARSLHLDALAGYVEDHGGEPDDETAQALWDHAREEAEQIAGRPIGYIYKAWMAKVAVASDVTDEMLRLAWEPLERSHGPRAEADRRGVAIIPNRSARGLPVCLVDVDPRHGGDVDGPWGMQLPGPKASTPGGGVHTLMLSTGKEVAGCGLGLGVDVVASGTPIPLPSGSATPGRRWLRKDPPVVAPEQLRRRGRRKPPPRVGAGGEAAERQPGDDWGDDEGQGAQVVSQPVGDGERNRAAGVLVGMLARPRCLPADFVRACLELLAEVLAGRDASSADARAEMDRWRLLLTRGPRDEAFAAEVMETWLSVRDTSRRRMRTPPAKFVASVWRVCDRREDGRAGEEDRGVGPRLGWWPPEVPGRPIPPPLPVPEAPPSAAQASDGRPNPPQSDPAPYPPPSPEAAQAAVDASRLDAVVGAQAAAARQWRGGVDPRTFAPSIGEDYPRADLQRDLLREPIRICRVMPAVDFATGVHSISPDLLTPPVSFGWGEHLASAKRGLSAGEFVAVGASSAGAGKTTFLAWLVNGLALQTACRLLGVQGYEVRPLVLTIWASEMPRRSELYGRLASSYLGFHRAVLDEGPRAHEAPGVLAAAASLGMDPAAYVAKARALEDLHGNDPRCPLAVARAEVVRRVDPGRLPRHSRSLGVTIHHRTGPDLVEHLADVVDHYRRELAARAGVPEDQVLPVVIVDPIQRFAGGGGESQKGAIDATLEAVNNVLCRELQCAAVVTSDTTKAGARLSLDNFLSAEAPGLMADVFAGSQGIVHNASDVIAVHPEAGHPGGPPLRVVDRGREREARPGCVRLWTRLLRSRGGGESPMLYPYEWERSLGRLAPLDPEPVRPPAGRDDEGRHRPSGGRQADHPAPGGVPRLDPDAEYRLHKSGARMRDGSQVDDLGLVFTELAKEAVALDGRAEPHPMKNRWWPDVVVSGRGAALILERMTCRHEKLR